MKGNSPMKLLLTSGGLRNQAIVNALIDLAGKPAAELKVAFIPTAMNVEAGDKRWAIAELVRLQDMGVGQIDIVDVSAMPQDVWLPRLEQSDVLFVNGGNTTHLMTCFNNSGLADAMPDLLKTRVYVGASAGSYVATPDLRFNSDNSGVVLEGLGLVDFGVQAHYKSPNFPIAQTKEAALERVKGCPYAVYVLDDQMAVKVDGDHVEVVGDGEHLYIK
jgi:dipeptidase E